MRPDPAWRDEEPSGEPPVAGAAGSAASDVDGSEAEAQRVTGGLEDRPDFAAILRETDPAVISARMDESPARSSYDVQSYGLGSARLARVGEELLAWLKTLTSAAVYATLIVTFGFQVARVEGQSMAPTLEDQDRLIVNKLAYRLADPQIGDIVMLYYPVDPDKSFVKRVVAGPDDVIRSVEGRVYRNDVPLPDDFIPAEFRSNDTWGPEIVPQGYYFVMGDHRNNSSDSRTWHFVPKKYIIGRVQVRWWPVNHARIFNGFSGN